MRKVSIKKISVMGLVLMAASAVIAAFVPSKKESRETGVLVITKSPTACNNQLTCYLWTGTPACNITAGSSTSEEGVNTSAVQNSSNGMHSSGSPC